MNLIFPSSEENQKKSIKDIILDLCSQWGGVTNEELKLSLVTRNQKECSLVFKTLVKEVTIRKVYYVTAEEYRWILS